jgi:hypothetical protein
MLMFGGFVRGTRTNDLYEYVFEQALWRKIDARKNSTAVPSPRVGHSAGVFENRHLFIFGGHNEGNLKLNDIWLFDHKHTRWTTF